MEGKPRGLEGKARACKRYDGRFMMADGQRARNGNGGINEDVSAEFDGVTATKRKSDVDDEKQIRAFIGFIFDECTVSRGMDERKNENERERDPTNAL